MYAASDVALGREVWVFAGRDSYVAPGSARRDLSRPTRTHWLAHGASDDLQWDAYAAVSGAPIRMVAEHNQGLNWKAGRNLLLQLLQELAAAAADGSLPEQTTIDQVFVEHNGHLKLLDVPIRQDAEEAAQPDAANTALESAMGTVRQVAALCCQNEMLPANVQSFVDALQQGEPNAATFESFAKQLRDLCDQRVRVSISDRLGVMATAACTEFPSYVILAGLLPLLWLIFPTLLGVWLSGGPALWLMGIEVRRKDGSPCAPKRNALRGALVWTPIAVPAALVMLSGLANALLGLDRTALVASVILLGLGSVVFLAGVVFAIFSPERGLQDLLVGTRLLPRPMTGQQQDKPALSALVPRGMQPVVATAGYLGLAALLLPPLGPAALGVAWMATLQMERGGKLAGRGRIRLGLVGGIWGTAMLVLVAAALVYLHVSQ